MTQMFSSGEEENFLGFIRKLTYIYTYNVCMYVVYMYVHSLYVCMYVSMYTHTCMHAYVRERERDVCKSSKYVFPKYKQC